jgi:hypothetical protein
MRPIPSNLVELDAETNRKLLAFSNRDFSFTFEKNVSIL